MATELSESVSNGRVVNLFVKVTQSLSMYLGAFTVESSSYQDIGILKHVLGYKFTDVPSKDELFSKEQSLMESHLSDFHTNFHNFADCDTTVPQNLTGDSHLQLLSAKEKGWWFQLIPWSPYTEKILQNNLDVNIVHLSGEECVERPIALSKEEGTHNVESLLQLKGCPFLSAAGQQQLKEQLPQEVLPYFESDHEHEESDTKQQQALHQEEKTKLEMLDQLVNCAVHSAAMSMLKCAEKDSIIDNEKIVPPRKFLSTNFQSVQKAFDTTGIKPFVTRPVHPPTLSFEPSVMAAMFSTETNLDKKSERSGYDYLINNDDAWSKVFQCIICSIFHITALQEFAGETMIKNNKLAPAPESNDFKSFLENMSEYKVSSRFFTHIFEQFKHLTIQSLNELLQNLSKGMADFRGAMISANTEQNSQIICRTKAMFQLQQFFNKISTPIIEFSEFQVHTIMRTIEMCLYLPFGETSSVPTGDGSSNMAQSLIIKHESSIVGNTRKEKIANVYLWIVSKMNERAELALSGNDAKKKHQIELELQVLGLTWNNTEECLYNIHGIGKKFDTSDAEHLGCCGYVQDQHTKPSKNRSKTPHIDSSRYCPPKSSFYPPYQNPIMKFLIDYWNNTASESYVTLLLDKEYEHRQLSPIFKCDMNMEKTLESNS